MMFFINLLFQGKVKSIDLDEYSLNYDEIIKKAQNVFNIEAPIYFTNQVGAEIGEAILCKYVETYSKEPTFTLGIHLAQLVCQEEDQVEIEPILDSQGEVLWGSPSNDSTDQLSRSENPMVAQKGGGDIDNQKSHSENLRSPRIGDIVSVVQKEGGRSYSDRLTGQNSEIRFEGNVPVVQEEEEGGRNADRLTGQNSEIRFEGNVSVVQEEEEGGRNADRLTGQNLEILFEGNVPVVRSDEIDDDDMFENDEPEEAEAVTVETPSPLNVPITLEDLLFHPKKHKGLLQTRIEYIAKKYRKSCGKKKKNHPKKKILREKVVNEIISEEKVRRNLEFMKNASVNLQKNEICEAYKENFSHRQLNLETAVKDYACILQELPELISYDFDKIYGDCHHVIQMLNELDVNNVYMRRNTEKTRKNLAIIIEEWPEAVQKVMKLLSLFHPTNTDGSGQKLTGQRILKNFVRFFPLETTPQAIVDDISKWNAQPQLVAIGANCKAVTTYCIKFHDCLWRVSSSFEEVFHLFFKVHASFQTDPKPELKALITFLREHIYKIEPEGTSSLTVPKKIANYFNM
ncbi:hypothetical protein DMENIID0001_056560 [Sergentomyia squamirostris]